jgi:hypothetical protein
MACITVSIINRDHTINLFIFSIMIREEREAAAPTSNARARETASHLGLDSSKNSIT